MIHLDKIKMKHQNLKEAYFEVFQFSFLTLLNKNSFFYHILSKDQNKFDKFSSFQRLNRQQSYKNYLVNKFFVLINEYYFFHFRQERII